MPSIADSQNDFRSTPAVVSRTLRNSAGVKPRTPENFAKADPYVNEGLVKTWTVRPWTVVVGQDPSETPPGLPK